MPWAVVESKASRGAVETAISDWESANNPTSIDKLSHFTIGPNRIGTTIVYTA